MFKFYLLISYLIGLGGCLDEGRPKLQDLMIPKQLQEGQSVKLHCDLVRGKQPVVFKWKFNEQSIENGDQIQVINKEEETTLKIRNLSLNNLGEYKCVVSNSYGDDVKQAKLYFNVRPRFLNEVVDLVAPLNSDVLVKCESSGMPPPLIKWQKLSENGSVEKEFDVPVLNLVLTRSEVGQYRCLSANLVGSIEKLISIKYFGKFEDSVSAIFLKIKAFLDNKVQF